MKYYDPAHLVRLIRPGARVSYRDRFDVVHAGRAVLCFPTHCVLNCGGLHGTPAVVTAENIVAIGAKRSATEGRA